MKRILFWVLCILLVAFVFFVLVPGPIDAVSWTPDTKPELKGQYSRNDLLDEMTKIFPGQCLGCEDIAIDSNGTIYAGSIDGDIVVFRNGRREVLVNTGGRPLGLDFDVYGNLVVADAVKGLLLINPSGQFQVLTNGHNGVPFRFTDDIEVGSDSIFYFTDASSKFGIDNYILDLVEHGGHGRFLSYDPRSGQVSLLMDGLQFANGVAVAPDASFALVNETGMYRVHKYWLKGPSVGQSEVIFDNLPGFPDGISKGEDGIFWLTLITPRLAVIDKTMPYAWLRNQVMKLPKSISEPKPAIYGMILGVTADGEVKYNYQSEKPSLIMIASVQQVGDELFMGSLSDNGIGKMTIQ